ncbi:hypothetical protein [Streptomyces cyaneus]|uniref:hypothetical protein n=1 Tax=Streptomyces cyaneus TaxID=1904 RepID=UPI000FF8B5D2|nr:hypothetical protein [Streptomyces cyaneus]
MTAVPRRGCSLDAWRVISLLSLLSDGEGHYMTVAAAAYSPPHPARRDLPTTAVLMPRWRNRSDLPGNRRSATW